MKGGKGGRPRKSAASPAKRPGTGRDRPVKGGAKRAEDLPPKKGSRKKPNFGGMPSSGDE